MLSDRQNSSYAKSTVNSIYIILINIERVSKHSVTIRGLRVVTTCWSWAWSNRTSPSKWVGLGSPLAACSVYGDLTCSVHTVNNLCMFNCQCHFYLCNWGPYVRLAFVPNMLSSWNKDIIIIIIIIFLEVSLEITEIHKQFPKAEITFPSIPQRRSKSVGINIINKTANTVNEYICKLTKKLTYLYYLNTDEDLLDKGQSGKSTSWHKWFKWRPSQ